MRLQLTVLSRRSGRTTAPSGPGEMEVEAPEGTTTRELARVLATTLAESYPPPRQPEPVPHGFVEPTISVGGAVVPVAAPIGLGPLVDGAAVTLGLGAQLATTARPPQRTPVALAVAHGPDAGRTFELARGVRTVGRSVEAAICLDDPRASRLHAAVTVAADTITLEDLGSTNGTFLDNAAVGAEPRPLQVGAAILVGDTLLVLRPVGAVPAAITARSDGTRVVNRRPRLLSTPTPVSIALPTAPEQPRGNRVPWIAMVLPIPFAAAMAFFFGPMMLAFALMSPLLMAGTALSDRFGSKRSYAAERAVYERHLAAARERVTAACAEETRSLRRSLPDPSETLSIATMPTARVWERRRGDPDALTVAIGRCTQRAAVRVIRQPSDEGPEHPALEQVPCSIPLAAVGVVGFCGDRDAVMGVLRVVLGQLTTLHSPLDLGLLLISGNRRLDDAWSWLGRLPHVRRPDGGQHDWVTSLDDDPAAARACVLALAERVRGRRTSATATSGWTGPWTVVVLDGASSLRGIPDLAEVLEHGPSVGVCVLALHGDRAELPSEAGAVLDLTTPGRGSLHLPGGLAADLVIDQVGPWWADRLSRGLAPLRDATPGREGSSLPTSLGLGELLTREHGLARRDDCAGSDGAHSLDATALARMWTASPHRTCVPVGVTTDEIFSIDLAADGPHILVAGTTGAGKSELLRTLVASLAVHNSPVHLSFVLIDYKGGAAFRECGGLPHVAGVVTDLDDHLADRALTSLGAELKRREWLLRAAGVPDFVTYQASSTSASEPLARLVIVIDEFRALAEELPPFIDGIVRVAALGRSLGVHVVLATQRPAGVVTADIKANVNLRIALRVRDRPDSHDVIDAPDAAGVDRAAPGRGYARGGGGSLVSFQVAHAGGRAGPAEPRGIRARLVEWNRTSAPWPNQPTDQDPAATDLSTVVAVVSQAVSLVEARPAPSPWLAALPTQLGAGLLPLSESAFRIPIGLADEPAAQRQGPLEVDLALPGHWGFVGAAGSGRTTALLTVVGMVTSALDATRLHLYAVSGGSLSWLESLPHCGAHVEVGDLPRLERLVDRLSADVADRRHRLAASGHVTMGDWFAADEDTAPPALLCVVDDWDFLAQRTDDATHSALVERLLCLFREGAGVGLTAVVAGERSLLVGRAASALVHRVLFKLNDPADALLAGLQARALPPVQPPGRGVLLDGTEVQIALPPALRSSSSVAAVAASDPGRASRRPWRVDALPTRVRAASLPRPEGHGDLMRLGLGGDHLATLGLSPCGDGRRWVISGSNGAGVSTTLTTIAAELLRRDQRVAVVATRQGRWDHLRRDPRVTWCDDPSQPGALVALRRTIPSLAVLVDNADELLDSPVEQVLKQLAAAVDRDSGLIVAGANAAALSVQYRGLAVDLARHRTGILLGPASTVEADVFGLRVPVDREAVPGRGYLVRAGVATPVQVAVCDSVPLPAATVTR